MPGFACISVEKLARLVGLPHGPAILDVRVPEDFARDPRLLPGSRRLGHAEAVDGAAPFAGRSVVVVCERGAKLSHGVAAWLRHGGADAVVLEGGFRAWADASLPMIPAAALPPRDAAGRTVWVTRARPKIDRIACPWLIRRFVDPDAVFLFVAPGEVEAVAERFGATPFDVEGVRFTHRGAGCSFDALLQDFELSTPPLDRVAAIVRGADTDRPDLAPEAAGLLALSLGLSRMHATDLAQLDAGMVLYDALYRWARDATGETHDWVSRRPGMAL
ncbi:sulfurtransferase [Prosthecomicrobium hirschii]|uniref:chromate resistance protein ChrB domain-containing protein n=1 Tax=Prosthecodimorpha hirschii TaxID=665126 RepID=UPI001125B814|nr:chromate resistance protein ChrB domain-containing protein [Prosthecomicrobium hirschii]TPQ46422.1 sulfurtransferase [Prosthecomicrobium hirschii]